MIFGGIDPGTKSGFAILDEQNQILHLSRAWEWSLLEVVRRVNAGCCLSGCATRQERTERCRIGVEVPRGFTYSRMFSGKKNMAPIARAVAINAERGRAIAELLRGEGYVVYEITPTREKKWSSEYAKCAFGLDRSTQDERDALRVACWTWREWRVEKWREKNK